MMLAFHGWDLRGSLRTRWDSSRVECSRSVLICLEAFSNLLVQTQAKIDFVQEIVVQGFVKSDRAQTVQVVASWRLPYRDAFCYSIH